MPVFTESIEWANGEETTSYVITVSAEDGQVVGYHFYNAVMARLLLSCFLVTALTAATRAQTPQPFPRAGTAQPQRPAPAQPPSSSTPAPAPQVQAAPADPDTPPGVTLGVTLYPGAQLLGSYDAGRGQRFYVFGATASFAELVGYYRTQTGERGDLVFKEPPKT